MFRKAVVRDVLKAWFLMPAVVGACLFIALLVVSLAGRSAGVAGGFMAHRFCVRNTWVASATVISDGVVGCSYMVIAGILWKMNEKFFRHRTWIITAFGGFILFCGFTHFMSIVTFWIPIYAIAASVSAMTALLSAFTALALPRWIMRNLPKEKLEVNERLSG